MFPTPGDLPHPGIAGRFFTVWATREACKCTNNATRFNTLRWSKWQIYVVYILPFFKKRTIYYTETQTIKIKNKKSRVFCYVNFTSILKNPRKLWERWPNIWKVNSIHQNNCGPEKKSEGKLFWTIVYVWSGQGARIKMCKKSLMQHLGELL